VERQRGRLRPVERDGGRDGRSVRR
jgi:hypothetical protein